MSDIQVTIEKAKDIQPIPGADNLEVVTVSGFPVVVKKGSVVEGGEVVYFPPEIQLPLYVAEQLGVDNYLRRKTIVKAIRLRGQISHGMALAVEEFPSILRHLESYAAEDNIGAIEGLDVSTYFGARRFIEPPKFNVGIGQEKAEHPYLSRYTDINRYEKMSHAFQAGEQVYVTEKVHGANVRVAMIDGELMVGSRKTQRKMPDDLGVYTDGEGNGDPFKDNMYWFPLSMPGVMTLLGDLGKTYKQVILYGEVFGKGIQGSFDYGRQGLDFVAFDLMLNGDYSNPAAFSALMKQYGVPVAPLEYVGDFDQKYIEVMVEAPSLLTKKHIREGIVIKPLNERRDSRLGRVVAKWINPAYLVKKSEDKIEDNQE